MKHYQRGFSLPGIIASFRNSFRGFRVLLWNEYNLYIQIGFACIAVIFGFLFHISHLEWAIQLTVIGLVVFSELVNTAIEKTMDLIHPEYNEHVRDVKDLASAAVLFMVLVSVAVGLFIYIPKVF
ncbi:diacylglycerol kinase family protein [Patescibacteria group bacterium]|nr:diacylglycerol kinase family protein [Patescibacteria group bacterium]